MNAFKNLVYGKKGIAFTARIGLSLQIILLCVARGQAQTAGETVLHQFNPLLNDGVSPYSGLIIGNDGALYGTTWGGKSLSTCSLSPTRDPLIELETKMGNP